MNDVTAISVMFTETNYCCFVTECAHLLLAHNAPVKVKNAQGWSPLAEAISYGDRQMSKSIAEEFSVSHSVMYTHTHVSFTCVYMY